MRYEVWPIILRILMRKYVVLVFICVLITACAGTKTEPLPPTQPEIVESWLKEMLENQTIY